MWMLWWSCAECARCYVVDSAVYLRPGGGCNPCVTRCSDDVEPVRMLLLSAVAVTTGTDMSTLLACSSAGVEEKSNSYLKKAPINMVMKTYLWSRTHLLPLLYSVLNLSFEAGLQTAHIKIRKKNLNRTIHFHKELTFCLGAALFQSTAILI